MRVALIGVSHWHLRLYLEPLLNNPGVQIVGVADPNVAVATTLGERLGCEWSHDYRELCQKVRPDFVFALGRHCDMAAEALFLMEEGVPFAMEKPCGISQAEIEVLAIEAERRSSFAAVPFVLRQSSMLAKIRELAFDDEFQYMSFKWIGSPVSKYVDAGVGWMLDRDQAGGGCLLNLGVHYVDLFSVLMGDEPVNVRSAITANTAWGLSIEDYVLVTLGAGTSLCLVETGYTYPSRPFDLRYSIRTNHHYFIATSPEILEVRDEAGSLTTFEVVTTNNAIYPLFVDDVLKRVSDGRQPVAGMSDMLRVMGLVQTAYAMGGTLATRSTPA